MSHRLWKDWFGANATQRLQRRILPRLRWNQEIWGETIHQHLTPSTRWLDAGCGWRLLGEDLEELENKLVNLPRFMVGVDIDVPHLRNHLNISRRVDASLDLLPFPDKSFDLITCNMVIEHLPEPKPVFQELSRLLAPGGALMVHTPNTRNYLVAANILAKKVLPRSAVLKLVHDGRASDDIFPTYYRANNSYQLCKLAEAVHLQWESTRFLTQPQPYTRFFTPAALFEMLLMRATMTRPLNAFAATIVMTLRKPMNPIAPKTQPTGTSKVGSAPQQTRAPAVFGEKLKS